MDDRLREAIGFPRPPRALVRAVEASLRARGRAVRTAAAAAQAEAADEADATARIRAATRSRRSARMPPDAA